MSRVVDRLFQKCGPNRIMRLKYVSRETLGFKRQPLKQMGDPWEVEGELDAKENLALYRFENGVKGVIVVTRKCYNKCYVRFYRLTGEPVGILSEYFNSWELCLSV